MPPESDGFGERKLTPSQQASVAAQLRRREANATGRDWRNLTLFDFSRCRHTHEQLIEVRNDYGIWGMMICVDCGKQTQKECPHVHCTWHLDGQVLICDNCGIDGT